MFVELIKIYRVKNNYEKKLEKCKEKFNSKLQRKHQKYESKLRDHQEELNQHAQSHLQDAKSELDTYRAELMREEQERLAQLEKERDDTLATLVETMRAERQAVFESTITKATEEVQQRDVKQMQEISSVNSQMRSVQHKVDDIGNFMSEDYVYKMCAVLVQLSPKLEEGLSFQEELRELRCYSAGDPLLTSVLNQIPDSVAYRGVRTVAQLREKFMQLKMVVRGQAYVPETQSYFWHLVALIVSKASFPVRGLVGGSDPDSILARAEYYLALGDLGNAVHEMESFTGLDSEILQEWLSLTKQRLAVDNAFAVIRTHLTNITLSQLSE